MTGPHKGHPDERRDVQVALLYTPLAELNDSDGDNSIATHSNYLSSPARTPTTLPSSRTYGTFCGIVRPPPASGPLRKPSVNLRVKHIPRLPRAPGGRCSPRGSLPPNLAWPKDRAKESGERRIFSPNNPLPTRATGQSSHNRDLYARTYWQLFKYWSIPVCGHVLPRVPFFFVVVS